MVFPAFITYPHDPVWSTGLGCALTHEQASGKQHSSFSFPVWTTILYFFAPFSSPLWTKILSWNSTITSASVGPSTLCSSISISNWHQCHWPWETLSHVTSEELLHPRLRNLLPVDISRQGRHMVVTWCSNQERKSWSTVLRPFPLATNSFVNWLKTGLPDNWGVFCYWWCLVFIFIWIDKRHNRSNSSVRKGLLRKLGTCKSFPVPKTCHLTPYLGMVGVFWVVAV